MQPLSDLLTRSVLLAHPAKLARERKAILQKAQQERADRKSLEAEVKDWECEYLGNEQE